MRLMRMVGRLMPMFCCVVLVACGASSNFTDKQMQVSQLNAKRGLSGPPGEVWGLSLSSSASSTSNLLLNPGFETFSQTAWHFSENLVVVGDTHSGLFHAWLGGYWNANDYAWQDVVLPVGQKAVLDFWYKVEPSSTIANPKDIFTVEVDSTSNTKLLSLMTITAPTASTGWKQSAQFDLSAFAGQTVRIRFSATTGSNSKTSFYLDDTSLTLVAAGADNTTGGVTSNVFNANRSNYSVVKGTNGFTVTNKSTNETKVVAGVQSLVFNDVTINLGIADKAKTVSVSELNSLIELYIAYLGRVPDADGLAYWIDQFKGGRSLEEIGKTFYAAAIQFPDLTGYSATMSDADFIRIVYKNVLGRTSVDTSGMNYWSASLASGAETRGTLVKKILSSAHTFKGDATYGWVADLLDNRIQVATSYAVDQGITFKTVDDSVANGIKIANATTATSTSSAMNLFGLIDPGFSLSCTSTCSSNGSNSETGGSGTNTSGGVVFGTQKFVTMSSGQHTVFGITATGELFGWGSGTFGALGNGSTKDFHPFTSLGSGFTSVSTTKGGDFTSFAIKTDGSLWAWGIDRGGLGNGSTGGNDRLSPVQIGSNFASVAPGYGCSFGIKSDGTLWAWGGTCGTYPYATKFAYPSQIGSGFVTATTSGYGLTAIKTDGSLWVWGSNESRLVTAGYPKSLAPYASSFDALTQVGTGYKALASTSAGVIALKTDGSLWTWGQNYYGEMGRGVQGNVAYVTPQQIGTGFSAIAAGEKYALGLKTDGSLWSWGHISISSLQTGADSTVPKKVGSDYAKIFASPWTAYAVGVDGSLWAWGDNYGLVFANLTSSYAAIPQKIQ